MRVWYLQYTLSLKIMYENRPDWLRIEESAFTYGKDDKPALIAICSEQCDRKLRPLACRIFPLTPYIGSGGVISIKIDPRAVPMCPLAKPYAANRLNKEFILAVDDVFKILGKDEEM